MVLVAVALAAGCDDVVYRRVTLAFEDGLPTCESLVVGGAVILTTNGLERLDDGNVMTAWGLADGAWLRLGPVLLGRSTAYDEDDLGVPVDSIEELLVTEEEDAGEPDEPSETVVFRGRPGTALAFGGYAGPTVADFVDCTATAELRNAVMSLTYAGLAEPVDGTSYAVWLLPAADATADQAIPMGELEGTSGTSEATGIGLLAINAQVVVTLELVDGVDEAALDSVVLRGDVPSASSGGGGGHAHVH
jgi:hypothetical protein